MGKRSRRSGNKEVQQTSDLDDSPEVGSKFKKRKPHDEENENSREPPVKKKKALKSSAELCAEYNMQDVELEYTDADYQNLTTYNLFVRLIRPQITAANPKFVAASKMNQIMEAKWREFAESNPFNKENNEEEDDEDDDTAQEEEVDGDDDDDDDEDTENDEVNGDQDSSDEKTEYDKSENSTEEYDEPQKKSSAVERRGGLKIKLSLPNSTRKSTRDKKATKKFDDEVEKFFDSDEDSLEEKPRKRKAKKKASSSDEDYASDDSVPKKKKRRTNRSTARRRKQTVADSSGSSGESSDATESEEESDDKRKRRGRRGKKEENSRPQIPGERRSERSRRSGVESSTLKEMTDREFEKMLKKQDQEQKEEVKKKKKQKAKKMKAKGKKGGWQDDADIKSGEESDHCWYCAICKDGGDLLLCDGCPKSFHQKCLKLENVPEGEWKCPLCKGEVLSCISSSSDNEEEDGGHDPYCKECRGDGDLLLCDYCPGAYHLGCLNPTLKEVPEGDWKCPRCVHRENPLKEFVTKIITWRWTNVKKTGEDEFDHTTSPKKKSELERRKSSDQAEGAKEEEPLKRPERELFVKYRYHSYWDCEWIPEMAFEVHQRQTWARFKQKWNQDEPPTLEDFGSKKHKKNNTNDPYDLDERYYRWGVKPEYLQIHRVVAHERENSKMNKYLVKWRELPYEEATFEAEDALPEGLEDWQKHVDKYWSRKKEKEKEAKEKNKKDNQKKEKEIKGKKKEWKKKLEKQPEYIDKTGGKLHPYQLEGFNWMRFSWAQDTNVILADEMGLGKTIQAIVFLRGLFVEGLAPGPFIISVPLSTLANWEREFEFWAPDMYVVTYIGTKETRTVIRQREFCYKEGAFYNHARAEGMRSGYQPKFDVLLTSYEMVNMDRATLKSINYSVLVIDEAHRLKSSQSLFFKTMSEYKIDYKLLLTGTPLQNTLDELFNLLNFLEPAKFNDMEDFLSTFADISKEDQVKALHDMLAPHMLRRLKADVLKDIPDKSEMIVRVELSSMQKKYYKHILTRNYAALNVKGHGNQTSLINIMMDLRKCCNHPYLFPTAESEAPLTKNGNYEGDALTKASGKLDIMDKMLNVLKRDGHRVLIFSQMTRMLDILEDFMEHHKYNYERIDGSVTGALRQERIDRFNDPDSSAFAFLLSTKAGGLGINLATADTVIIYDMDWNPHNDIQAFSRAHRIGQKNKVMIYRYVSCNSVEEKMTQVCKQKMMLSELVIAKGGAEKKESLTKQEVNDILKFGAEDLFKDTEEGRVTYDAAAVERLLDRSQAGETEKSMGMNEYLRSFNVATYKVKEGPDEEEEEEEEEEDKDKTQSNTPVPVVNNDEDDPQYWQRVLGDSYAEHIQEMEKEQALIEKSLGKGKRVRKQINYAETALMSFMSEKEKKKRMNIEVLEEDNDGDEDYMSDYKPDVDSSQSSEDDDDAGDIFEGLDAEEKKKVELARQKKQYLKEQKELKKMRDQLKAQRDKEKANEALPPLLAKVNGNIEVLGFTARQRRSFLDAVMRFGMPPEDCYQSQWLVRDLRMKSERVFKAYMSLFMRHLCEPVADDAEKFADGVPREGLSRQHVLTRIGMIALIRRKVGEYESTNKVFSMDEFTQCPKNIGESSVSLTNEGSLLRNLTNDKNTTTNQKDNQENLTKKKTDDNNKENKPSEDKDSDKKNSNEVSKEPSEKTETGTEKSAAESYGSSESKTKEGETDMDTSTASNKETGDDKPNEETDKTNKSSNDDEKTENESESKSQSSESNKQTEESVDSESKEKESKAEEDSKKEEDDKPENGDQEKGDGDKIHKTNDKNCDDEESKKKENGEEKMDTDEKTNQTETDDSSKKQDNDKESEKKDAEDKNDGNTKEGEKQLKDSKNIETQKKDSNENTEQKTDDKDDKEKNNEDSASKEEKTKKDSDVSAIHSSSAKEKPLMYNGHRIRTLTEIQDSLRKRFWVSDGGFTELHAVWNHEESLLLPGSEWLMWHRRHDFWLLAGVITHGYRHWQDIMNDPRFSILNRAFRPESDRLKRAAFLNRRFQLLEQALVIEEQLRKAAVENTSHFQAAIQEVKELHGQEASKDLLSQVDQFAANLRKISHGLPVNGPPPDTKVHRAISTLSGLITDIRQITYKTMPSTLAMTEHGAQAQKTSMLAKQMMKDAASRKVISIDD